MAHSTTRTAVQSSTVSSVSDNEYDDNRSVDSDDAGSLVDFIADDDDSDEATADAAPLTGVASTRVDLDGIDTRNIVTGKRRRAQTSFYEQTVMNTDEYRSMMLDDVPPDEIHAVYESSDDAGGVDASDDDYSGEEEEEEEDEEDEEDENEGGDNGDNATTDTIADAKIVTVPDVTEARPPCVTPTKTTQA